MSGHCLGCGTGFVMPDNLEYCSLTLRCRTLALAASLRAKGLALCKNSHVCTVLKNAGFPVAQQRTHYVEESGAGCGHGAAYKRSWGPAGAVRIASMAMHPAVRQRLLSEVRTNPEAMRKYATFSTEELLGVTQALVQALTPEERLPGSTRKQ